jgi:lysophospholipase L1-like esterase
MEVKRVRIMPLGDSITCGLIIPEPGVVPGGYRTRLYHRLTREWRPVEFVGSANDNPGVCPSLNHEGHGGWRIDELRAGLDGWLAAAQPDIVLVHAGTNDMVQGYQVESAPQRLGDLLSRIKARVFVAQIISRTDPAVRARIERFNAAIPAVAGRHAVVDMFSVVPVEGFADAYHPNQAGYDHIADAWFKAITA